MTLTRRQVLAGANAVAFAALLSACTGRTDPSKPVGTVTERALKLLREAVEASPDHLTARASRLVDAKDAAGLVALVRDHVAVIPWTSNDYAEAARRWGGRATLRGAQGTLRDRAELLASLLTRAGFKATVRVADRPAAITQDVMFQPRSTPFAPDEEKLAEASRLLGVAPPSPSPTAGAPLPDPVAGVLATLPASLRKATLREDLLPDQVPVVSYVDGGKTRYGFALGALDVSETEPAGLTDAPAPGTMPTVVATVSAIANPSAGSSTPRGQLIELVRGEWTTEQVVGRQLLLTFVPPQGPKVALSVKPSDIPVRVPLLSVQAEMPLKKPLAVVGKAISTSGDVLVTAKSEVEGPFGPVRVLSDAERKAAIARAASVKVEANASTFPEIDLDVSVLDAGGGSVEGLDAASFAVTDNGAKTGSLLLRSNAKSPSPPRVLVAYDNSASVSSWPSEKAKADFDAALAATLSAAATRTPFEVQVIGLGDPANAEEWKPPVAAEIVTAIGLVGSSSDVWFALGGQPLDAGPAAVVLVSDVQATDDPASIPAYQRRLAAAGIPVFTLAVGEVDEKATATILELSHGSRLDPTQPGAAAKLAKLIEPLVVARQAWTYRLRYRAAEGTQAHTVTVAVGKATGEARYQVPAKPSTPTALASLYLTLNINGIEVRRRLAGLRITATGTPIGDLDDADAAAEVRAVLQGVTTVAVEPGTTTPSALFADVIDSMRSLEPLRQLPAKPTPDDFLARFPQGARRVPAMFAALLSPPPASDAATSTLRVAVLQERMNDAERTFERHLDLVPALTDVAALGSDPKAAFDASAWVSAAGSLAEAAVFDDSALARLRGQQLTVIAADDFDVRHTFLASIPEARRDPWYWLLDSYAGQHVLAPVRGAADAVWVVDPRTGSTTAVMLNGAGGGMTRIECSDPTAIDVAGLAVTAMSMLISPFNFPALGFVSVGLTVCSIVLTVASLFESGWNTAGMLSTIVGASTSTKLPAAIGARMGPAGLALLLALIAAECSG